MTVKTLEQYYASHAEIYKSLAETCSSAEELLLTIDLQGTVWTQWDWALFFEYVGYNILLNKLHIKINNGSYNDNTQILLLDILNTIKTNSLLDKILTNKKILCCLIDLANNEKCFLNRGTAITNVKIYNILAQLFKKFPRLWNMSYMFKSFKGKRYHRLCIEKVTRAYDLTKEEIAAMTYGQHLNKFIEVFSI